MAKNPNDGINERVGNAIAAHRAQLGLTQAQLAEELGVDKETIGRFERGVVLPPVQRLVQLADIFQMPLEDLIRGVNSNDVAPDISRMISRLNKENQLFVRHIVEQLCERLATRR